MTDQIPNDGSSVRSNSLVKEGGELTGQPDEPYYNEKGEVDFVWKEKPLKPGYERPIIIHRAI